MEPRNDARSIERELRTARMLIGLAVVSALVAIAAGLILIVATPAAGSTTEGALGFTAAIAGFSTAGFAIAAAIYTQIKDLWRLVPVWFRLVMWGVIIVGLAVTAWNLISQAV